MNLTAKAIWASLEFRTTELLRLVAPLSPAQFQWIPAPGRNSVAWQVWHIAEVEDNWVRSVVLGQEKRYPFGYSVRDESSEPNPAKDRLLSYFSDVRALTEQRLESTTETDFTRVVHDDDFGELSVLDIWAGVATSCAWHGGQVAMTVRLMPIDLPQPR